MNYDQRLLVSTRRVSKERTLLHQRTVSPCVSTEQRLMMFTSCDRHTQSNLEKFHKRSRLSRSHELVSVDFITLSHRERTDPPHAAADAPSSGSGIRNECYGCDAAGFKQSQKPLNTMKDAEIRAHHLT